MQLPLKFIHHPTYNHLKGKQMVRSFYFIFLLLLPVSGAGIATSEPLISSGGIIASGYVWANNPTAANYSPMAAYSFNSSGEAINIQRLSVGRYLVTFNELGGNGVAGGHVQISDYGAGSHQCRILSWASNSVNFIVNVQCQDQRTGTPLDARYSLQVSWGRNL